MTNHIFDNSAFADQLHTIEQQLSCLSRSEAGLRELGQSLNHLATAAQQSRPDLFRGSQALAHVVELAACWTEQFPEDNSFIDELVGFTQNHWVTLHASAVSDEPDPTVEDFVTDAESKWNEYLAIIHEQQRDPFASHLDEPADAPSPNQDHSVVERFDGVDLDHEFDSANAELSYSGFDAPEFDSSSDAFEDDSISTDSEPGSEFDSDLPSSHSQIELMLSAIHENESSEPESGESQSGESQSGESDLFAEPGEPGFRDAGTAAAPAAASTSASQSGTNSASPSATVPPNDSAAKLELAGDQELLEAFLDDAMRCLSSMEQAALAIEDEPEEKEPIQQFCRELHTLKGASATVGLAQLASYLHELESSLGEVFSGSVAVDVESLFAAVDRVREEMSELKPQPESPLTPANQSSAATTNEMQPATFQPIKKPAADFSSFASNDNSSIRIRAAKLDRLMDMLAELVVLRNRRESHVAEFNAFNEELARCASRLSFAEEQAELTHSNPDFNNPFARNGSNTFSEVGKDIGAVSQGLRDMQKPVSRDNSAISQFIRDFRQELMQLRRIPVTGLFNRLQRATRDAAKSENKQVQVKLLGEQAGLEQEIQERLFESLLHIVRNSVSHGIEDSDARVRAGKDPVGTVTLEAYSSAQLLIIEVRDDGNGLNYEAVQRRAIEKGLLNPNQSVTQEQLAKLIFHPGFSTREQASEISGRGVGMDIVARTIEQLHGRIEISSVAGQGTTMRVSVPLRTGIEHVMVFRSDGQLFALPMQSVTAAKTANANIGNVARLSLTSAFSMSGKSDSATGDVLLLRRASELQNSESESDPAAVDQSQLALAVDELIGPEEVVVRGLPNLLKSHPLFCGITLSGSGEKVLIMDSEQVLEFCHQHAHDTVDDGFENDRTEATSNKKRALVVDDSLTARKMLAKILQRHNFATVEAGDGIEAIERLHREKFDLVLTDLDMPRLGGLELLTDIQSGQYCDAPRVVVSSRDEGMFRTEAMDVGASDYLTKPVSNLSVAQLLERLELLPTTSKG